MRVNDLSKEMGIKNKELLEELKKKNFEVKSHLSNLTSEQEAMLRNIFSKGSTSSDNDDKPKTKKLTAVFRPQNVQTNANQRNLGASSSRKSVVLVAKDDDKTSNEVNNKEISIKSEENLDKMVEKKNITNNTNNKKVSNTQNDNRRNNTNNNQGNNSNNQRKVNNNQNRNSNNNRYNDNKNNSNNRNNQNRNSNNTNSNNGNYSRNSNNQNKNSNDNRRNNSSNYASNRTQGGYNNKNNQNSQNRNKNTGFQRENPYLDKDKDESTNNFNRSRTQRKPKTTQSVGIDEPLAKKTTSTRINKNNFKNQKNDKRHRTEDGPARGKKVTLHPFIMPVKQKVEEKIEDVKEIIIPERISFKEFATKLRLQPSSIVKKLFLKGQVININADLTFEEAEEIALEYDVICTLEEKVDVIEELLKEEDVDNEDNMVKRAPVVCVMGHVDHGKTSLLDAIRSSDVTSREAGGITQHIGAYMVKINDENITFLDTPGHEAFTAMRMRGAKSTDIAILVVAADDGVMPQTIEAINHAKAAEVEIIVAINKIDKPGANLERVKQELSEHELIAEDWGGSTIFCPVSAKTGEGISNLLEMITLTAEVKELKADPNRKARGLVLEAELDKGKGSVATVLVQKGTLRVGDFVAAGACSGKVRAMINDKGERVKEAKPSTPVEILGLDNVPNAGEVLVATANDKEAKAFAATFISESKNKLIEDTKAKLSLDDLFNEIKAGNIKDLPIIIKADVQGSVEAVKQSLTKLSNEEVQVKVIHGGVGSINESDVSLAAASNAIIIGFNVRPDVTAKTIAEREKVDLRLYSVIYKAIEDIEAAMKGMLEPIYEEQVIGHAEIRQIFKASGIGTIAGSYVLDGKFVRGCKARITRAGELIFDGPLASLKRFKDDVKEVNTGYECGLVFEKFNDLAEMDLVEAYDMVEVARK